MINLSDYKRRKGNMTMGLGKKNEYDDYGTSKSNMKLIYVLIALTVVTVALIVLLVLFLNGTFGGGVEATPTPTKPAATTPAITATPEPTPTPAVPAGEVVSLTEAIAVEQVPVGSAPSFAMGTGSNLGSIIVDNSIVYQGDLLLVNASSAIPAGFLPNKLVNVFNESRLVLQYPISVSNSAVQMEQRTLAALTTMLKKAEESGNTKYFIDGAYRIEEGYPDYQTGLAYDIGFVRQEGQAGKFAELPQGQWMIQNCYQYGFVQRFTAEKSSVTGMGADSTLYRYVGFPHSLIMQQKNMCLEEYVAYVRSSKTVTVMTGDKVSHEIMYVYADPTSADGKTVCKLSEAAFTAYSQGLAKITVSGDNFGGFIVTVIYL